MARSTSSMSSDWISGRSTATASSVCPATAASRRASTSFDGLPVTKSSGSGIGTASGSAREHAEGLHLLLQALELELAQRLGREGAGEQAMGLAADGDLARLGDTPTRAAPRRSPCCRAPCSRRACGCRRRPPSPGRSGWRSAPRASAGRAPRAPGSRPPAPSWIWSAACTARRAWSLCGTGAPKNAITQSPMNLSSVPPAAKIASTACVK